MADSTGIVVVEPADPILHRRAPVLRQGREVHISEGGVGGEGPHCRCPCRVEVDHQTGVGPPL